MISKRDAISTAETLNKLVLHSWNLVSTNGEGHFLNLTMDDRETSTFFQLFTISNSVISNSSLL